MRKIRQDRPGYLKIEFPDFLGAWRALIQHRDLLRKTKRNSPQYRNELKTHFQLLIFAKAHALSLDTRAERRRLLNLLMKEMDLLRML